MFETNIASLDPLRRNQKHLPPLPSTAKASVSRYVLVCRLERLRISQKYELAIICTNGDVRDVVTEDTRCTTREDLLIEQQPPLKSVIE
jgi:hypothetical protein